MTELLEKETAVGTGYGGFCNETDRILSEAQRRGGLFVWKQSCFRMKTGY